MRTTLDIDEDVLRAAKELARRQNKTAGQVISELARKALTQAPAAEAEAGAAEHFGFRTFPRRGGLVTNELVDRLQEPS
jgi:hypothetical protein